MILYGRSKCSTGGWTLYDMLFVMLPALLAAFLVSVFFDREWRVMVFLISYVAFLALFSFSFFFWLIPTLVRRQQKRDKPK